MQRTTKQSSPTHLNGSDNSRSKHLLHPHNIALGTIADENLAVLDNTTIQLLRNLLTEWSHALFGTVSGVSLLRPKLRRRRYQSGEDVLGYGLGGVANAKGDDPTRHIGICLEVGVATAADFGEAYCTWQLVHCTDS